MPRREPRKRHLRVPVTEQEALQIEKHAAATGLGIAAYLRAQGLQLQLHTTVNRTQVDALVKAMGDLGRLGGLLKLWLSDDAKLAAYPPQQVNRLIPQALQQILHNQRELLQIIQTLKE